MATNISFPTYGFVNEILALSEDNWRTFFKPFITDSVQSGLATIAGANMTVYVSAGECRCGAVMGILDEMIALDVANGDSTYDRIDSVIVQYTYGEPSTLAVAIVQGTPSANPVPPTLTKVYDTLWQMEIAQILVPSGATSSSEFTITDKRVIYESIESIIDDNTESEERVWSSQKTREEIVSLSTEIYDSLNTKADVIERTASGDIVTITDGGNNLPVKELVVDIDPVQDLHGYDNPWPAGGGKNICPNNGWSQGQINSSGGQGTESFSISSPYIYLSAGTYTLSRNYTDVGNGDLAYHTYNLEKVHQSDSGWTTNPKTFTLESDCYIRLTTRKNRNTDITPAIIDNGLYVQLESGSSVTSFTPYSNICPISGHTSAMVTRTGKNLFDKNATDTNNGYYPNRYIGDNGEYGATQNYNVSEYIDIKSNTTYTLSPLTGSNPAVVFYDSNKTYISGIKYSSNTACTFTTPNNAMFLKLSIPIVNVDILQLELGSTASSYEPYQGTSVTIDLDGTRYGGVLDVLTGEMTVDRIGHIFDGTETFSSGSGNRKLYLLEYLTINNNNSYNAISSFYPSRTVNETWTGRSQENYIGVAAGISNNKSYIFIVDNTRSTSESISAYQTWLASQYSAGTPLIVVWNLATPLTVQLTPSQLSTLLGQNNLWADTGDVAVTYRADSKMFIDEQIAESQIKTRQMITIVTDKMIAPNNLSTNDIVVVNDELYKATANIASGAEMTVGTNVIKITLAEYIQSLL